MYRNKNIPAFLIILFSWIFGHFSMAQEPVDSSRVLRVLTYNIYHGETMQGDFDLDLIARVIREARPDIVALQEVDLKTNRAKKMHIVTELGIRTGMAPLFGRAMYYDGGEYGEGILSRFTFLTTKVHALPHQPGKEPRAALEVNFVMAGGDTVRFIGTHLDHTSESQRLCQARRLSEWFRKDDRPAILAGDLNALPSGSAMKMIETSWARAFDDDVPTWPSDKPKKKIDYVLFRPQNRWKVLETKVIDEQVASDHRPVLVVLELLP